MVGTSSASISTTVSTTRIAESFTPSTKLG